MPVIVIIFLYLKCYVPNYIPLLKRLRSKSVRRRNTVPWTYVISDLNEGEIVGTFYGKELQKENQTEFRIEKLIIRNGYELYGKWKDYNNLFNN